MCSSWSDWRDGSSVSMRQKSCSLTAWHRRRHSTRSWAQTASSVTHTHTQSDTHTHTHTVRHAQLGPDGQLCNTHTQSDTHTHTQSDTHTVRHTHTHTQSDTRSWAQMASSVTHTHTHTVTYGWGQAASSVTHTHININTCSWGQLCNTHTQTHTVGASSATHTHTGIYLDRVSRVLSPALFLGMLIFSNIDLSKQHRALLGYETKHVSFLPIIAVSRLYRRASYLQRTR